MKIKQFDVIKLNNGNKAIIKNINEKNSYTVEIVNGKTDTITDKDIKKVIFTKEREIKWYKDTIFLIYRFCYTKNNIINLWKGLDKN